MISAQIGRVTGTRPRRKHAPPLSRAAALSRWSACSSSPTRSTSAPISARWRRRCGCSSPARRSLYIAAFAVVTVLLEVFMRYSRYASVLRWLTLSLFAYVGDRVRRRRALGDRRATISCVPHIEFSGRLSHRRRRGVRHHDQPLPVLLAGRPKRSRSEKEDPDAKPLARSARNKRRRQLARIQLDTLVGMGFSNIIALVHHADDRGDAQRARRQGHPDLVAGRRGAAADRRRVRLRDLRARHHRHRAAGVAGARRQRGLCASARRCDWRVGLAQAPGPRARPSTPRSRRRPWSARRSTSRPLDPIKALFWSAVINGVAAVPIMVMIMLMGSRREVMGQFTLEPVAQDARAGWRRR